MVVQYLTVVIISLHYALNIQEKDCERGKSTLSSLVSNPEKDCFKASSTLSW